MEISLEMGNFSGVCPPPPSTQNFNTNRTIKKPRFLCFRRGRGGGVRHPGPMSRSTWIQTTFICIPKRQTNGSFVLCVQNRHNFVYYTYVPYKRRKEMRKLQIELHCLLRFLHLTQANAGLAVLSSPRPSLQARHRNPNHNHHNL
jgi:hypothetical protein